MHKLVLATWLCLFAACGRAQEAVSADPASSAQNSSAANQMEDADAVEEVLVVGEQPGPALIKISKGEHVLWVMGTLSPLPKNIQWRSAPVTSVLAQSQEFIMAPNVKMVLGFWDKVAVAPSLIGVKNNPDGKKLQEVLPEPLYQRWLVLKEKYIGKDKDIEKHRPIFAAAELFKKAIAKSGMVPDESVRWTLENVVRDNKIPTTKPTITMEFESPRAVVKKFKQSTLDDTECFARTLDRLETDLDAMRARANAWATGDMPALKQLPYPNQAAACGEAVLNSELVREQGWQDMPARMDAAWLAAAENALANNPSSFALLPMPHLTEPDGYVAKLRAKGYEVSGAVE